MYAPDLRPIRLALAIALILPLDSTLACGPSFPMRLLDDRANSLAELPEGNFAFEISRLAAPLPGLKPVTEASLVPRWEEDNSRYLQQRDERERSELGEERWRRVQALRALGDARRVEAEGAGLPAEILLYTAGAVAFRSDPEQAREYFRRVLALPAPERRTRSTWAAYSLGRLLAADSRALPAAAEALSDEEVSRRLRANAEAAQEAFRLTRRLAIEGFDDPLELAAASLGEEALLAREANDWGEAIRLYANQAMLRSDTGYSSLRQLSGELARMPDERLEPLLAVPEVQQLLTVRLLTRGGWFYDEQLAGEQHLAELLMALDVAELPNADRLAALSYRYGRYDNAGRFLEKAGDSGLAWWLRAKLALRAGDTSRATEAYARAAKAFPEDEEWGVRRTADWEWETVKPRCRVEGESAILALQRGDYLEAFDNLYRSGAIYWLDAAAVAERVLTLDELKSYVDAKVPAPPPQTQEDRDAYRSRAPAAGLREVLGRRLLREGRYDEAPAYFESQELRAAASEYGQARKQASSRWTAIGRAESYYRAARLARRQGMELLGYEMSPDFHVMGGNYSFAQAGRLQAGGLLAEGEVQRQNASLAQPNARYHYRWIAADLAERAADELPHTSQAFAAVLCKGSGWVQYVDLSRAQAIYLRYVEHGPFVKWAGNFGMNCEEPDFDSAYGRQWEERRQAMRDALYPVRYGLAAATLFSAAVAAWLWRRRFR
ncbi:hypothetical protein [Pseudomonas aeruginosa]|uniref:hypothetical protein n=1 Tax=Pseudomonas aeruginosa TaxID=287 RepID=UPI00053F0429|nr:hypothetical protein [Pseudomonas aeruginosa]MBF8801372.1 hypothetical protein [Pseudomonas aeruginosa]MDV7844854.1 hypothetical protein [Pseudomonas aeruginosa]HBO1240493.1 hypothetical protein [Pseudomonas aeruginosa]HBO1878155.1 hypothetical protein [Pseudomonas aeruginosa]HBO2082287.1 hypothetical protein [Pseudomonas aeruginosa]